MIVDESGIRLTAEAAGLGAEIRGEVSRAMSEALAGQDRSLTVDIDVDPASQARMRAALQRIDTQVTQMTTRIRTRTLLLSNFILTRINAIFNRLRLRITQLRTQLATLPRNLTINVELDTGALAAQIEALTRERRLTLDVEPNLAPATAEIEAWRRAQEARALTIRVVTDQRGAGIGGADTTRDTDSFRGALERLEAAIDRVGDRLDQAGRRARTYTTATRATTTATDAAAAAARAASDATGRLTDARTAAEVAVGKLAAAEEKLSAAEQRHERTGAAIETIERRLVELRGKRGDQTDAIAKAENDLAAAMERHATATAGYFDQEARLTASRAASEKATRAAASAERDLGAAMADLVPLERDLSRSQRDSTITAEAAQEASAALDAARRRLATSNTAVTAAERQLARARADTTTSTARVEQLEQTLTRARGVNVDAVRRASDAERDLATARDQHEAALGRLERAQGRSERSGTRLSGVFSRLSGVARGAGTVLGGVFRGISGGTGIVSRLGSAITGASGGISNFGSGMAAAGGIIGTVVGLVAKLGLSFAALGGKISAFMGIAGAVTGAFGAIGAAVLALPPILTAGAAAFGVIKLGFDNFSDAIADANTPEELQKQQEALNKLTPAARATAEAFNNDLKPAFDEIKKSIQEELFLGMDETVRQLATTVRSALGPGLVEVAGSVNRFVKQLAGIVTGEEGVNRVRNALSGARTLIDNMTPGVRDLVRAFLDFSGVPSIMQNVGGIISDVTGKLGGFFDEMRRTGEAQDALAALRGTVSNLTDTFLDVTRSAINFTTETSPGFNNLVTSVGDLATSLIDDLGGAFNTALQAASDFIDNIPAEDLDAFKQAITDVADAIQDFANSPAPGQIVRLVTDMVGAFETLINIFTTIAEFGDAVDGFFNNLMVSMGTATDETTRLADEYNRRVGEEMPAATEDFSTRSSAAFEDAQQRGVAAATGLVDGVNQKITTLPGLTQATFDQLPPIVRDQLATASQAGITEAEKLPPGIQGEMSKIPGVTQVEFDKLPPLIQAALTAAADTAAQGAAAVPPNIQDPLSQVPDQAAAALDPTAPAVEGSMGQAADAAAAGSTAVVGNVDFTPILDKARELFGQVPDAVRTGIDQAAAAVNEAGPRLVNAVRDQFTQAVQAGRDALGTGLQDAVREACAQAEEAMRQGVLAVVRAANFDAVAVSAETALPRVATAVQVNLQTAQQHAQTHGQQITQTWTQQMAQVEAVTTQSWQRVAQAHQQGGQQSAQINQRTAQAIAQIWQQMGEVMYQAGFNMMIRLAQGIQQGGQQAIAAAQQVAQAIQGLFPMSPPKWGPLSGEGDPLKSGQRVMERLAAGAESRHARVLDAMTPTLAAIAGSLDGATPAARTTAVNRSMASAAPPPRDRAYPENPPPATNGGTGGFDLDALIAALTAAVRNGVDGARLGIRDDGRGGIATIANRGNRTGHRRGR